MGHSDDQTRTMATILWLQEAADLRGGDSPCEEQHLRSCSLVNSSTPAVMVVG